MAQKREKEETELKVPEAIRCTAPIPTAPKLSGADDQISSSVRSPDDSDPLATRAIGTGEHRSRSARSPERPDLAVPPSQPPQTVTEEVKRRGINRCSGCLRKVGLTGFRCRCGEMFCSEHRYSDRHDCSFDYKAAGREAIARENPVVRAAKILKV